MKKKMKQFLSVLLAGMMMFSTLSLTAAAEEEEYQMFLGFGGDFTEGSWDASPSDALSAKAKVGDTVTITLTFDNPVVHTYWLAPVIVAEGVKDLSYTIDKVLVDDRDVTSEVDLSVGDKAWWYEGTSDTAGNDYGDKSIRLKGGHNDWADSYLAINDVAPDGYQTISYTITLNDVTVGAASAGEPVPSTETYHAFLAIGAEAVKDSWDSQYYGEGNASNREGVVAVEGDLTNGETTTLSVTFPEEITYTWFVAPCFVVDDPSSISDASTFEIKVLLDGEEIETDLSAGKSCWAEGTGDYSDNCVRIGGGYNEWGDKYIAESPTGYKTIEFQITPNIMVGGGAPAVLSEEEYPAFLAIGAGLDWGYQYYGNGNGGNSGVADAVEGVLKSGETTTLSVTFENEVDCTWFVAPCMVIDDPATVAPNTTFAVKVFLDGEEVETDLSAGDLFWAEDTGDYAGNCVRIGGGYNEWAAQYIAEPPAGYTTISFEITPEIYIAEPQEEEAYVSAAGPVDLNGTYNAYLGIQTPKYSFRNAFDDATYGRDTSDVFQQVTAWDAENNAYAIPGTFTDAVIAGNGTYTVSLDGVEFPDGEFADQDYMNLIFLSTDIPNTNEITISDIQLKIDGKSVDLASCGAIVSPDSKDYLNMLIQNNWNEDVKTIGYYAVPFSGMSITFTVSGFAYDAGAAESEAPAEETPASVEAPAATEAPAVATEAPDEKSGSNTGLIVGVVAAVAVVGAGAGVVVSRKKKK